MNNRLAGSRPHPAFTLVELLVTLAIIAILAVLSAAGFVKMRSLGDMAGATCNLAQLQLANLLYVADNNGKFTPVFTFDSSGVGYLPWTDDPDYLKYLKGDSAAFKSNGNPDLTISANLLDPTVIRAKKLDYDLLAGSFGYNMTGVPGAVWGKAGTSAYFLTSQLTAPERSAAFSTATDWNIEFPSRYHWAGSGAVEGRTKDSKMAYRHNNKALIAYYDGHVGVVSVADLKQIDANGGAQNIFWKGDAR